MSSYNKVDTLVNILRRKAISEPTETIYTFLSDGCPDKTGFTFGELDQRARAIARRLLERAAPGERAVLMYPAGLEFIAAFFACLYAGIVAVPAVPPRNRRTAPRIEAILRDAEARLCLTDSAVLDRVRELVDTEAVLVEMHWIATDRIDETSVQDSVMPKLRQDSLAFIQYTSGSTNTPRGVMVSHGNLIRNLSFLCDGRGHSGIVSWLPLFHDAGLIYAVLQALYAGVPCILMPPASFLQRPLQWLNAISESQYSTSVAPNFAYELCIEKISEAEKAALDLSQWTIALNGAEPVKFGTLKRFASAFACCGFRPECLKPAYGLAEATLGVSISKDLGGYQVKRLKRSALAENRVVESKENEGNSIQVVGCGSGASGHKIAIVNPESLSACGGHEVGEIWFSGPSVACGYWRRSKETLETFQARLLDSDEGPFLRTGDLGFIDGGELFITGRLKDLIIIRGGNHYPQDIEHTVQESHSSLQRDAGAAFSTELGGEDRLVLVQELVRHAKVEMREVLATVRENVAEVHGIQAFAVLLIKPHSVPKTSSGKIQRRKTCELFLEDKLEVLAAWRAQGSAEFEDGNSIAQPTKRDPVSRDGTINEDWLVARLAEGLKMSPNDIENCVPLTRYGLDSLCAVSVAGQLQDELGRPLSASLLFDYPTIESLIRYLNHSIRPSHASPCISPKATNEPIAVIGIGCRFPKADTPQAFWELLCNGVDAIAEVPRERWDAQALYDSEAGVSGKANTKWGGFLKDVDMFAAEFFEISPREAAQMDPQQRLLLEVAWEALENSGIPPSRLAGSRTGVFVGISGFDYSGFQFKHRSLVDVYAGTGLAHSIAANRISYFFDLKGPSVIVDTACSSSLVAIHQACESLRRGESDLVLSGGVNLILSPEMTIALSHARMMASDGRCKTFDSRADGYVRGEGCAIAVLKRLSDAERDGDPILALIHGSAVNQDGRSNGLTAPNGPAQTEVISEAIRNSGIAPSEVSYVECHGTGTALGDPQEVEALRQALEASGTRKTKYWIGSVKTNIGHLEAAAGIASLLKVVLSLKHKRLPASLHFKKLNPKIRLDRATLDIPTKLADWESGTPRFAGVSSFGFGGTNCHVILGEAPEKPITEPSSECSLHLLTLSAKTDKELKNCADAMAKHMASQSNYSLGNICFTANTRRNSFTHRLALVTDSCLKASEQLEAFVHGGKKKDVILGKLRSRGREKIAFLFPGRRAEYTGMGRFLFDTQPVFRGVIENCDNILRPLLDRPLLSVLYPSSEELHKFDSDVYARPALCAVEYALAMLWKSWGIVPDAVFGHGFGEYTAACVAGVFDLETALRLIVDEEVFKDFERFAQSTVFRSAEIPIVSNVTGDWYSSEFALDANYWSEPRREPDRFANGLSKLFENGHTIILECGPGDSQVRMEDKFLSNQGTEPSRETLWISSLREEKSCVESPLEAAARLYVNGFDLDWSGIYSSGNCRRVELPSYGFERKRFWIKDGSLSGNGLLDRQSSNATEVHSTASLESGDSFLDEAWESEAEKFEALNELSLRYMADALRSVGAFPSGGEWLLPWELKERSRVIEPEKGLLKVVLMQLAEAGMITEKDGLFSVSRNLKCASLDSAKARAKELWNKEPQLVDLVVRCGDRLAGVLKREQNPLALLFPNGDVDQAEWIYRDSRIAKFCNARIKTLVGELIKQHDASHPVRLLEVGGGTGATASSLCSFLRTHSVCYTFTDIGPTFVERARSNFSSYPFVDFGVLNIEMNPEAQGFKTNGYDIVIAANVIHATSRLSESLANVRKLLAPQGSLILWETTRPQPWLTLTFGLLEGWNRFEDTDLRSMHPLLSPEEWRPFLERSYFDSVQIHPASKKWRDAFGQAVVSARIGNHAPECVSTQGKRAPIERSNPVAGELIYQIQWIPGNVAAASIANPQTTTGNWLILCDHHGFGKSLAESLKSRGQRICLAFDGNEFERVSARSWRISIGDASQFQRLVQEWRQTCSGGPILGIVDLWGLNGTSSGIESVSDLRRSQVYGCEAALHLVQAMSSALGNGVDSGKLWIVTRGAQSAGDACRSTVDVCQAPLWGFGRTLASEERELWGGLVDLDPDQTNSEIEVEIVANALLESMGEDEFLIRDGLPSVPRLRHARFEETRGIDLDPGGTYLITGGLGGIGLALSKRLVERGARRLVLLGRSKLPSRSSWQRLIVGQKHPLWEKLEALLNIERLGASVLYVSLDVANEREVSTFLKRYNRQAWPPVRGVFHCAGVSEDATIARMKIEALRRVFDAKATGAWNVFHLLADQPVEFFVFFSSAASTIGSHGGVNYAAANSFLDSLAPHISSRGVRALSVSWGPWAETGMADSDRVERLRRHGVDPVLPDVALDILFRLLSERDTHYALVADICWNQFLASSRHPARASVSELHSPEVLQNSQVANARGGNVSMDGGGSIREKQKRLIGLVAELIQIDDSLIDPERKLYTLGLDSIMAVQFKHELELQFGYHASNQDLAQFSIEELRIELEQRAAEV